MRIKAFFTAHRFFGENPG